jgi:hypothetical protein
MAPRATSQPTSPAPSIPTLPDDAKALAPVLGNYLNQFALWCRNSFGERLPANQALPYVLLQASDPAPNTTPKVFKVTVNTAGSLQVTNIPLGSGLP